MEARMALAQTSICDFGWKARDFSLKGVDGKNWTLNDVRGRAGTLVVFICNHCPYVRAIIDRLAQEAKALQAMGIGVIAIMPNDTKISPGDTFDNMKVFAAEHDFSFPYVMDETQKVAREYGAVCTPDFFGFDKDLGLRYRGRLMPVKGTTPVPGGTRELLAAMRQIAATGQGPADQNPGIGCSIKWRSRH
jgi:peroxiredoxin